MCMQEHGKIIIDEAYTAMMAFRRARTLNKHRNRLNPPSFAPSLPPYLPIGGWITGHSYVTYGPLLNGASQVVFEGVPSFPDGKGAGEG